MVHSRNSINVWLFSIVEHKVLGGSFLRLKEIGRNLFFCQRARLTELPELCRPNQAGPTCSVIQNLDTHVRISSTASELGFHQRPRRACPPRSCGS